MTSLPKKLIGSIAHSRRSAIRRLAVERLEPKVVLSATSGVWGNAPRLTVSFAPDGTDVASLASDLHAKLNHLGSAEVWQQAILAAFQTWAVHTNADVGLVTDGGQPFGSPGAAARDARFGDVRIAAVPMSSQVLASAVPHDAAIPTTWAGDILFNSLGQLPNREALFSVALHEAGHVLGLGHSDDPASPMHVHGISGAVTPTPADIAALHALHGQRGDDVFDAEQSNDTLASASRIRLTSNLDSFHGETPLVVHGDITTPADVDYYYLTGRSNYAGSITFTVRSAGISLLAPHITLYAADGSLLDAAASTSRSGDRISVQIPVADEEATYYLAVRAAANDLHGIGGYAVVTTFDDALIVPAELIDKASSGAYRDVDQDDIQDLFFPGEPDSFNDDMHADDSPFDAPRLKSAEGFVESSRYTHVAGLVDATDVDVYEFRSPETANAGVMTVLVESFEAGGLIPRVDILDRNGVPLPTTVLANGGGQLILQVSGVEQDRNHFIRIAAADPTGPFATGNYRLSIVFGEQLAERSQVASGTLSDAAPQDAHRLYVSETQLMHVALDVDPVAQGASTLVLATLANDEGQTLLRLASTQGQTRTAQALLLPPGEYYWQVAALTSDGAAAPAIGYRLLGASLSDPTGPALVDPTGEPTYECPANPDLFCFPDGTVSPHPYAWSDFLGSLTPLPDMTPSEILSTAAGDWWSWFWNATQDTSGPQLRSDVYGAMQNEVLTISTGGVLANDATGSPLLVYGAVVTANVQHGTLDLRPDGTFDYTPTPGFVGFDSFSYAAASPLPATAQTAVTIHVLPSSPMLPGDLDNDGRIGIRDATILRDFLAAGEAAMVGNVDLNSDGLVNGSDLAALVARFGESLVPQAADAVHGARRSQAAVATSVRRRRAMPPPTALPLETTSFRRLTRSSTRSHASRTLDRG